MFCELVYIVLDVVCVANFIHFLGILGASAVLELSTLNFLHVFEVVQV